MSDMEKVIFQLSETYKVLEIVTPHFNQIMDYEGMIQGCKDAIALLKEQDDEIAKFCGEVARLTAMLEEHESKWIHREDLDFKDKLGCNHFHGMCGNCGFIHDFINDHTGQYRYCPQCGMSVKWE